MSRRDGSRHYRGGMHHPSSKGKGHQGRKVMKTRREASGMDKAAFEALLRRMDIQGRAS